LKGVSAFEENGMVLTLAFGFVWDRSWQSGHSFKLSSIKTHLHWRLQEALSSWPSCL